MAAPLVYLVHLQTKLGSDHPKGGAGHYIGQTIDLERRLAQHREGTGARILAAANERGIAYDVVRTWPGGRDVERRLKNLRNAPRLCPTCVGVNS
jgi:GIY-YIG catalytic domain